MTLFVILADQLGGYFRRRIVVYAVVVALFGLGLVSGGIAVSVVQDESRHELSGFVEGYLAHTATASETQWSSSLTRNVMQEMLQGAGLPWILGLTVLGAPLILALVFLKGFALGFTIVFLFDELSYRGILLMFAGIVPHSLLKIPALLLASGAALTFALATAKILVGRQSEKGVWTQLAATTTLAVAAALFIATGTWIQEVISPILIETIAGYIRG